MKNPLPRAWFLSLTAAALAAGIWLVGFLLMRLPLGDPFLRLSYDALHLFTSHQPDPRVLVVALNEDTDRKLSRHHGEPFSRRFHARLLDRLKQAGAERVCFDILFDLPSSDPAADEALIAAVKAHGHVILGGTEEGIRRDKSISQNSVIAPFPALRKAAEGWGLLNVSPPDVDGVIRRFNPGSGLAPPLAAVAAQESGRSDLTRCAGGTPGSCAAVAAPAGQTAVAAVAADPGDTSRAVAAVAVKPAAVGAVGAGGGAAGAVTDHERRAVEEVGPVTGPGLPRRARGAGSTGRPGCSGHRARSGAACVSGRSGSTGACRARCAAVAAGTA